MSDDLADLMFGPAQDDRQCGDCVACCIVTQIEAPELSKPEGEICPHCSGQGCAIYDRRPRVCRTYNCAWKRIATMPLETRPDRLGVMFTLERSLPPANVFEHLFFIGVAVSDPGALDSPLARDVVTMLSQGPLPVWLFWAGTKTLVHPDPDQADAILHPGPPHDPATVAMGRAWLERYAPFARLGGGDQTRLPDGL